MTKLNFPFLIFMLLGCFLFNLILFSFLFYFIFIWFYSVLILFFIDGWGWELSKYRNWCFWCVAIELGFTVVFRVVDILIKCRYFDKIFSFFLMFRNFYVLFKIIIRHSYSMLFYIYFFDEFDWYEISACLHKYYLFANIGLFD